VAKVRDGQLFKVKEIGSVVTSILLYIYDRGVYSAFHSLFIFIIVIKHFNE